MRGSPSLILAAHGSADPGYPAVFEWVADRIIGNRPDMDVLVGYLDHNTPRLADLPTDGAVVVPMLLATGFHLQTDIPAAAPGATIAAAIGPDPRLTAVVADRLRQAGWSAGIPVTLAAAGSRDVHGLADVRTAAAQLAERLEVEVTAAFVGSGQPALSDLKPAAVATYLLAPGHFTDAIAQCGASIVSSPIGPDPRVAEVAMSRFDAAVAGF
ncbi:MAG TPA: CbiX/SirB N-terminal domain-containing protein [Mycobacteriales bacterium]|nr:CbiX/SirB N-terminal domain-containing protein [Mycobacteriales bacterium]